MNRYYKAEDIEREIVRLLQFKNESDFDFGITHGIETVERVLEDLPTIEVSEEDELKFYYVDSIDDYWIGQRLDNFYYAKWNGKLGFVWSASRYLPWGEHVVAEDTLWKEHTYPSEPREIPFTEWIVGFMKKYSVVPNVGDAISREHLKSFGYINKGDFNSVETIREWIDNAPPVIPQMPNEDAIGREELIKALIREKSDYLMAWNDAPTGIVKETCDELDKCIAIVINAPSVIPKQKEGEWAVKPGRKNEFRCSKCGKIIYADCSSERNYCSNCGSKNKVNYLLKWEDMPLKGVVE